MFQPSAPDSARSEIPPDAPASGSDSEEQQHSDDSSEELPLRFRRVAVYTPVRIVEMRMDAQSLPQYRMQWAADDTPELEHTWETEIYFEEHPEHIHLIEAFENTSTPRERKRRTSLTALEDSQESSVEEDDSPRPVKTRRTRPSTPETPPRSTKESSTNLPRNILMNDFDSDDDTDYSDDDDDMEESQSSHAPVALSPPKSAVPHTPILPKEVSLSSNWASLLESTSPTKPAAVPEPHVSAPLLAPQPKPAASLSPELVANIPKRHRTIQLPITLPSLQHSCVFEAKMSINTPDPFLTRLDGRSLTAQYASQAAKRFLTATNAPFRPTILSVSSTASPECLAELRALAYQFSGFHCSCYASDPEQKRNRLFCFPRVNPDNDSLSLVVLSATWAEVRAQAQKLYRKAIVEHRKLHLVLDLDMTMIFARKWTEADQALMSPYGRHFRITHPEYDMLVALRPGVGEFLNDVSRLFEVSIYTAANLDYARQIVSIANRRGWGCSPQQPMADDKIFAFWDKIVSTRRLISSANDRTNIASLKDLHNSHLFFQFPEFRSSIVIIDDTVESWTESQRPLVKCCPRFTDTSAVDTYFSSVSEELKQAHSDFYNPKPQS